MTSFNSGTIKAMRLFGLVTALCVPSAVAQTRICVAGDLDHLAGTERAACNVKAQMLRDAATTLKAPGDWHFVVVCDAKGWEDYSAYAMLANGSARSLTVSSDVQRRESFFRADGDLLREPNAVRAVLASELSRIGHIHTQVADLPGNVHTTPKAAGL